MTGGIVLSGAFFASAYLESRLENEQIATLSDTEIHIYIRNEIKLEGCQIYGSIVNLETGENYNFSQSGKCELI